ncbi:EamA family transporter [Pseudomonas sp. BBP2017]|nr:EamA family transporter [Pseudomonas sp. BBP2017]
MAVAAMCSVQFGAAMSAPVMEMFGSVTTTWLRLCIAALILAVVVRPSVMRYTPQHWIAAVGLGAAMACMTFCFFAAIAHVPLGLAVAIEFLGPLCVAAVGLRKGWGLLWPLLAATGILLIARQNDSWTADTLGLTLAAGAALGWAGYILLMKRVGSLFKGMEGLSSALIVAALLATPFGLIESAGHVPLEQLFYVSFLALLVPLVPYVLELNALRRMTTSAFGILMSLEPAIGVLAGFVILQQPMSALQCLGTLLVVTASVGALRSPKKTR